MHWLKQLLMNVLSFIYVVINLLDQLHRLHMILKPFMLRRVKRDVEQEIAPKAILIF